MGEEAYERRPVRRLRNRSEDRYAGVRLGRCGYAYMVGWEGVGRLHRPKLQEDDAAGGRGNKWAGAVRRAAGPCEVCGGSRLKRRGAAVPVSTGRNIAEVSAHEHRGVRALGGGTVPERSCPSRERTDRARAAQGDSRAAAASCSTWAWGTCRCAAVRRGRSRAARASVSGWPRRSVPSW